MTGFVMITRLPASADDAFVGHVARTGRRLPASSARAFWLGRRTYLRKVLEGAGWEAEEIEEEIIAFGSAVRAEAARQRAARQGATA